jgi:membrane carboxypeptidase/penicillin-binding protein
MYILVDVMKGVVDRGTAAAVRSMGFKLTAAGKTGTTNDKRDAWFIGFTPRTLALTWIGFDDNTPVGLSGGEGAVPIWTRFMLAETAGQPNADFPAPQGITFTSVDETSGGLSVPMCPPNVVVQEAFKDGTQPQNPCPLHSPQAPPLVPVDQFGNPVALDTTGTSSSPTETGAAPPPPPTEGVPPPQPQPQPRPEPRSDTAPPPMTNTSTPPASTNTSAPPTSTSTNPPG